VPRTGEQSRGRLDAAIPAQMIHSAERTPSNSAKRPASRAPAGMVEYEAVMVQALTRPSMSAGT